MGMHPNDRSRLTFMVRYAARPPERIVPHARRLARDTALRLKSRDHVSYYRAVMKSDAAGRLFIDYLEPVGYYGIDISPDILLAAQRMLADLGLQEKLPHLTVVQDLKLAFLPPGHFDVVHAHSVFSHSPVEVIEECLAHVGRVMKPDGFFDFTFDRTDGAEHHVLREDFYYRTETLVALAGRYGLNARFMTDWEKLRTCNPSCASAAPPSYDTSRLMSRAGRGCHGGDRRGRSGSREPGRCRRPRGTGHPGF
jgi:SAM-dependent methyltransferase